MLLQVQNTHRSLGSAHRHQNGGRNLLVLATELHIDNDMQPIYLHRTAPFWAQTARAAAGVLMMGQVRWYVSWLKMACVRELPPPPTMTGTALLRKTFSTTQPGHQLIWGVSPIFQHAAVSASRLLVCGTSH